MRQSGILLLLFPYPQTEKTVNVLEKAYSLLFSLLWVSFCLFRQWLWDCSECLMCLGSAIIGCLMIQQRQNVKTKEVYHLYTEGSLKSILSTDNICWMKKERLFKQNKTGIQKGNLYRNHPRKCFIFFLWLVLCKLWI